MNFYLKVGLLLGIFVVGFAFKHFLPQWTGSKIIEETAEEILEMETGFPIDIK